MSVSYAARGADGTVRYPLDPLDGAEIQAAAAILARYHYLTGTTRFVTIQLAEPDKGPNLTFDPWRPVARRAFVTAYDPAVRMLYEAVVDITSGAVESWTPIPGRFPWYAVDQLAAVQAAIRADPWPAGYYGERDRYENSAQICRAFTFMRAAPAEHGYARPVEGVITIFDL